jgi:hypothetical protein
MVGVGTGTGHTRLALKLVVDQFDRDFTQPEEVEDALDLLAPGAALRTLFSGSDYAWESMTPSAADRREYWQWAWLEKPEARRTFSIGFMESLGWGLLHPKDVQAQLQDYIEETNDRAGKWADLF